MNPAVFVTLEGIEGVGKTSAVATAVGWLEAAGHAVVATREPGGTQLGERVRELLLDPRHAQMAPLTELLLLFAARAQHLAEVIRPALARGASVVCDRYTDATYAYQGGGRGLAPAVIAAAEALVHPGFEPNLTILLDAPPSLALTRARRRSSADRFEREELAFFERVRTAYRARAAAAPARWVVIDATRPLAAVHADIAGALARHCA